MVIARLQACNKAMVVWVQAELWGPRGLLGWALRGVALWASWST
jgi:hypothetical protein